MLGTLEGDFVVKWNGSKVSGDLLPVSKSHVGF